MDKQILDLYADYLLSSFSYTTATGLSKLLDGAVSHDQVTRMLAADKSASADLWRVVKPIIREIETDDGLVIFDDSIEEKPYTDENEIICWHYDHSKERNVKGINFLTALYHNKDVGLPVAFDLVSKTEWYTDKKTGKQKRRSPVTKNERYRAMLQACVRNKIRFRYVLNDSWFAGADNMKFIKHELKRDFIMALKSNRLVALSLEDKAAGHWQAIEALDLPAGTVREVYFESVDFPCLLAKQVFTNEDGSTGILYLVTSDLTLDYDRLTTIYQKRWKVEEYHRSLKQNASLAKSPTRIVTTQTNHFFAALCAYVKLEKLKVSTKLNHYQLKTKLYLSALQTAYQELRQLNPVKLSDLVSCCVT
ncbi:MAG: transposase [Acidobacteria bacterium]|nr:transposase [Acidobacteriota bacterium]